MQREKREPSELKRRREAAGTEYLHSNVLPEAEEQRQARIRRLQELEEQQLQQRSRILRSEVKNRRREASQYTIWQVLLLTVAAAIIFASVRSYIGSNSDLMYGNRETARLKTEYEMLKSQNDSLEVQIENQIDSNEVYRTAVEKLGMVYPQKQQIVIYHKTESGYVVQNEAIPQE